MIRRLVFVTGEAMETLRFEFSGSPAANSRRSSKVVGVVGSGQLEVMIEPANLDGQCVVEIETSATGFTAIWEAVLRDFLARWPLGDVRISVNDGGATPAVVVLRLEQAAAEFLDV
jgi:malonate decarboxylase delta subunit